MEETRTLRAKAATMQTSPDHYRWQVPGKPVTVLLDFNTLDRLLEEVMRGFGLVPRKSVEVGGILLGQVERSPDGAQWTVRVEDFEPVPCRHLQGPAYTLSEEEEAQFERTLAHWQPRPGNPTHGVGFYRSHARAGLGLTENDLRMYNRYFPDAADLVLLVKPFATRASVGAFFFREGDQLRAGSSYLEFPFRRRELGGEPPLETEEEESVQQSGEEEMPQQLFPTDRGGEEARIRFSDDGPVQETEPARTRRNWVWIPLSFIFLLLGVVLGFQVAISVRSQASGQDPYLLDLTAAPAGNSVHVRWDRNAPAIQAATRGSLVIEDGGLQKTVPLDSSMLRIGSITYNRASADLRFQLEVFARDRVTISEALSLRIDNNAGHN